MWWSDDKRFKRSPSLRTSKPEQHRFIPGELPVYFLIGIYPQIWLMLNLLASCTFCLKWEKKKKVFFENVVIKTFVTYLMHRASHKCSRVLLHVCWFFSYCFVSEVSFPWGTVPAPPVMFERPEAAVRPTLLCTELFYRNEAVAKVNKDPNDPQVGRESDLHATSPHINIYCRIKAWNSIQHIL